MPPERRRSDPRPGAGARRLLSLVALFALGCASAGARTAPGGAATRGPGGAETRGGADAPRSGARSAPARGPASSAPAETASPAPSRKRSSTRGGYRIYVGEESADAVAVVDGRTWKVLRHVPVGISVEDVEGVHALTVSPDGRYWYVSVAHGFPYGSLWKFAVDGDSLVARTQVGSFPATIGLTPDGTWAFVVNYNLHGDEATDTVSAVYTPTMTEVTQIPVCVKPHGLDVSDDGRFVLVTCTRDDTIVKIDAGTLKETLRGSVRLPEDEAAGKDCYATAVQATPGNDRAYVSCGHADEIRAVDLATLRVTGRIAGCKGAYLMGIDPEARRLWVPCRSGQEVVVVDTGTNDIVARIATTREFPHTLAFSPDGAHALLTQESKGVIPGAMDIVDRRTFEKVASVDIGLQATGIGVAPDRSPSPRLDESH